MLSSVFFHLDMQRDDMKRQILSMAVALVALPATAQFSNARREYVEQMVSTSSLDRNYGVGDTAVVKVEAYLGGVPLSGARVCYEYGDEIMPPERRDTVEFSNGVAMLNIGTRTEPGFKTCNLSFVTNGKSYRHQVKVAFSPDSIKPFTVMPADFDRFWNRVLKEAGRVDLAPEVTPLPSYSTDKVDVFLVKLIVGKNGRNMYGYLTKPRDGNRHPVLFCPPGAGMGKVTPTTYYSEQGFVYLNIGIHSGCNPEMGKDIYAEARKVAEEYNRNGIESKETFYYKDVYAGCSRCVDFLCSLPEWDGKNVGVTGGSQGGALALTTAALNKRVTFCAAFYPALCDLKGYLHGRAGGWPKYFKDGDEKKGTEATLDYYDVVNFARRITCPVFFSMGYNDNTCPPTSTYGAYNEITSPKTLVVTPTSAHWRFKETNDEAVVWMKRMSGMDVE